MERPAAPGIGVDSRGGAVIDPTQNVLDLVRAAIERQDDLRVSEQKLYKSQIRRLDDMAKLRADYDEKLRIAEAARIDAIRAVDQGNVTRASEVAAAQATALATQLAASAEQLRAQVEATRVTTADALATALAPITNDVAVLREVQFRQQGEKSQQVEQRGTSGDRWAIILGILIVLSTVASVVGAHIH